MNYKMMKMWAQGIIVHINIAGEDIDDQYLRDLVMHLKDIVEVCPICREEHCLDNCNERNDEE